MDRHLVLKPDLATSGRFRVSGLGTLGFGFRV